MKYFVCADIHGFYDEWIDALNKGGFDINNPNHKIIVCGDLFDRGRKPKEIIDFILSNKDKFVLIRGNHEDLMQSMIYRNDYTVADVKNGTVQTILDLCPEWKMSDLDLVTIAKKTRLQEVLDMCVDYFETEDYIFVHGWIPTKEYTKQYDSDWRNADANRWYMARWTNPVEMYNNKIFEPNKTIVCGHWHCSALWHAQNPNKYDEFGTKECFVPFITKDIIALDACTVYTKKINVIVREQSKILQKNSEYIEKMQKNSDFECEM